MSAVVTVCPRCGDAWAGDHGVVCRTCGGASRRLESGVAGRIYSWTTVFRGLPGTPVPYTLAYADFGPELRLFARVGEGGSVVVGAPVVLEADEDAGFRFAVADGSPA